ncbi:MAG: hypothetical protein ACYDC4_00055 [Candidatus Dormibacteria bacterium]
MTPQLATAISGAPAVFVGTVISVDHAGRVASVRVQDVWKGRVSADVQVVGTPDLNAAATTVDRYYSVGQKYLFIPFGGGGNHFQDNNCTLTQAYTAGLASFRPSDAVGPPQAAVGPGAAAPPPVSETPSWPFVAAGGGLIVLILVMLFAIAQRRRQPTKGESQ